MARPTSSTSVQRTGRRDRAQMRTTVAARARNARKPGWCSDGGIHSSMYCVVSLTAKGDRSSVGPVGVRAAAASDASGTSARRSHWRRPTTRSRAMPRIATTPMTTPKNHMPWEHAQTQDTGTSHQRGRPSRAERSHAAVKAMARAKETRCGRSDRLWLIATNATDVTAAEASSEARGRVARQRVSPIAAPPSGSSHATPGRPNSCCTPLMSSSGSHSWSRHGCVDMVLHGSGPSNVQVRPR